jgi:Raf kinase inhibitor-like YbhB/YbcL family protein
LTQQPEIGLALESFSRSGFTFSSRSFPMRLVSTSIREGAPIPKRFTCDVENISFEFSWEDVPKETKSFVLILHDPDAPRRNGFTHWLLYDIPPTVKSLRENLPKQVPVLTAGLEGKNDSGEVGYTGPCPPFGNHRYLRGRTRFESNPISNPGLMPKNFR